MKVLFKELVVNVGHPWEIKEVKSGYAMNFLIPQWKAIELTSSLESKLNQEKKSQDKHNRNLLENRHKIVEELNGKILTFQLKTGWNGKVFGWIWEKDIIKEVKAKFKIELTKKHIELLDWHIKKIGETFIYINLGKDSKAKLIANVEVE